MKQQRGDELFNQNQLASSTNTYNHQEHVLEVKPESDITAIGLSRDKSLLTVGGRNLFKIYQIHKNESGNGEDGRLYQSLEQVKKVLSRKRKSLDYGIYDVQWNPSKYSLP